MLFAPTLRAKRERGSAITVGFSAIQPLLGEFHNGRAVSTFARRGGAIAAHEGMAAQHLVNGSAQRAGSLAVDDAHALQAAVKRLVEVAVNRPDALLGPIASDV